MYGKMKLSTLSKETLYCTLHLWKDDVTLYFIYGKIDVTSHLIYGELSHHTLSMKNDTLYVSMERCHSTLFI